MTKQSVLIVTTLGVCCPTKSATDQREKSETCANEISDHLCANCEGQSRPVSRKTVLLMLKPHLLEEAMTGTYSFCSSRDCPVVYFEEHGSHRFTVDDLRVPVGVKATEDPIPLCYCFGFDESHIRDQISQTGTTNVPQRISALIREGLCGCESRNPSGVCCLGEVNRVARRLSSTVWSPAFARSVVGGSPTCSTCLKRFRLRAYIVWLPMFPSDSRSWAQTRSDEFKDDRLSYYWDGGKVTGEEWAKTLGINRTAWDVYFLYGSESKWEGTAPAPSFWMHQLGGVTKAPLLDKEEFKNKVKELLASPPSNSFAKLG